MFPAENHFPLETIFVQRRLLGVVKKLDGNIFSG
jgi:hypothetical protein